MGWAPGSRRPEARRGDVGTPGHAERTQSKPSMSVLVAGLGLAREAQWPVAISHWLGSSACETCCFVYSSQPLSFSKSPTSKAQVLVFKGCQNEPNRPGDDSGGRFGQKRHAPKGGVDSPRPAPHCRGVCPEMRPGGGGLRGALSGSDLPAALSIIQYLRPGPHSGGDEVAAETNPRVPKNKTAVGDRSGGFQNRL